MKNYMVVRRPANREHIGISTSYNAPKQIKMENRTALRKLAQLIRDEFSFQVVENLGFYKVEVCGHIPLDRLLILSGRSSLSKVKIVYMKPTVYEVYEDTCEEEL